MKNEGNTTPPKEHSKLPLTDSKESERLFDLSKSDQMEIQEWRNGDTGIEMEIQELLDKGFKIILLKILRATREHR